VEGDCLLAQDSSQVRVPQVKQTEVQERVYNLRVAEFRTYFVGCDEWGFGVWAHNICLFHGSPDVIPAGGLSVAEALKNKKPFTPLDGIYLSSSNVRACGFAAPNGTVVRVNVDDAYAAAHAHSNPTNPAITDFVFQTQPEVNFLNGIMEVLPQAQAYLKWGP
jgi:hypothetical protein